MQHKEAPSFPTYQQWTKKEALEQATTKDTNVIPQPSTAFPQYMEAVLPKEEKFKATGVYVDDEANIHLHVMIDGTFEFFTENVFICCSSF